MSQPDPPTTGNLPLGGLVAMIVLVAAAVLVQMTGSGRLCASVASLAITETATAGLIVLAAGGYGWLILRRLAPAGSPSGLVACTSCALGLWMLSTMVLAVGTFVGGALKPAVWWPIVAIGVVLAYARARPALRSWDLPRRFDGRALIWVAVAAAAAMWIAGAARPPGSIGGPDSYDVMEYHLQVPREYFDADRIGPLDHNCYSFFPMGMEMLYLLGMCLRNGAYEGMYLANFLHGAMAALAIGAVFVSLRRWPTPGTGNADTRARFAVGLIAAAPCTICLGWLAMSELAQLMYLAVALMWLRHWLDKPAWGTAAIIGAMLGAACATKYLAVAMVAGPVLAVMLLAGLWHLAASSPNGSPGRWNRLSHVAAAGGLAVLLWSPWLIRNAVYTGNPVFPLASGLLGRGYWDAQSQQRWQAATGTDFHPPVPPPPHWQAPPATTRLEDFYYSFLCSPWLGPMTLILAGVAICALAARRGRPPAWEWSLVGVLAAQVALWAEFTHEMPWRFLTPAVAPAALLASGALAQFAAFRLRRDDPSGRAWGQGPAVAVFIGSVAMNLMAVHAMFMVGTFDTPQPPFAGRDIAANLPPFKAAHSLPPGSRILMIGEAKTFYFPSGTVYATCFDANPLAEMTSRGLSPEQIVEALHRRSITHLWVGWQEAWHLAESYGYPAALSAGLFERAEAGLPPGLDVLDQLKAIGMREVTSVRPGPNAATSPAASRAASHGAAAPSRPAATTGPATRPWLSWPDDWPVATLYELPK